MRSNSFHYMFYISFLFLSIDQGDGRWRTSREKVEHDVAVFKKMADKIETEIEGLETRGYQPVTFKKYAPEMERLQDDFVYLNTRKRKQKIHDPKPVNPDMFLPNVTYVGQENKGGNTKNYKSENQRVEQDIFWQTKDNKFVNDLSRADNHWPKFDDILLGMGRKYDWKNDRWIKVKIKEKQLPSPSSTVDSKLAFFMKHKFTYKSVKLNRSKTKRNLVIAVSAVR